MKTFWKKTNKINKNTTQCCYCLFDLFLLYSIHGYSFRFRKKNDFFQIVYVSITKILTWKFVFKNSFTCFTTHKKYRGKSLNKNSIFFPSLKIFYLPKCLFSLTLTPNPGNCRSSLMATKSKAEICTSWLSKCNSVFRWGSLIHK